MARTTPPPWLLGLLLVLIAALPVRSALGFGEVGGYRMFTRLARLELRVVAIDRDGHEATVPWAALRPHLGPDARRITSAALQARGVGDAAEGALSAALPELTRVVCIESAAHQIRASLFIYRGEGPPEVRTETRRCDR